MTTNTPSTTASTTTSTAPRRPMMAFFALPPPPPMTLWVQLDNGMQLGFTPTPERLMASMLGLPMLFPGMSLGGGSDDHNDDGFMRMLHELFVRSQQDQSRAPPPTSKSFLDNIPVHAWNATVQANAKHSDCPICLCEYELNDQVLALPCGHVFHKDCGMKWLVEHNVCPTCRHELPTQQQEDATKAAAPTPTQAPAQVNTNTSDPEREPEPEEPEREAEAAPSASRVRRQMSPQRAPRRVVRRRLDSDLSLPGAVQQVESSVDLDRWMDEEATRFVAEEAAARQRAAEINFDDVDVEELMQS